MPATLDIAAQIDRLSEELENALAEAVDRLDSAARRLERDLYTLLLEGFVAELDTKDGKVLNARANLRRLWMIEKLFLRFRYDAMADALEYLPGEYLSFAELAGKYFEEMELGSPATLSRIARDNELIAARLGLDAKGKIAPGGYLDDLFAMADVRTKAKSFILATIAGEPSQKAFTKALKSLVVGAADSEGILTPYFRRYAADTFNQIHELKNQEFAEALDLGHFLYAGSTIDTTRDFCRKKVGKVFTVAEALAKWPKDADLIGKSRPEPYYPLIDRGRWNCRHFIKYISKEMYEQLKESEQP